MPSRVPDWEAGQRITEGRLNRMVDAINAQRISVAAPLRMTAVGNGILLSCADFPHLDLIELSENLLAGKFDKDAALLQRDFGASSGDADQFMEMADHPLHRVMDAMRSVWLEGHRGIALYLGHAGQRVMLGGTNWHVVEIIDADLTSGGSTNAKILTPLSGSLADAQESSADIEIVVNDIGTGTTTPIGTRCIVLQHPVKGGWWVVPFGTATGGGSSGAVVLELPTDLTQAQQTKTGCTVIETYDGGPAVSSTVTARNPAAKGGGYQWKATGSAQYVNAIFNGTDYTIVSVQHVTQTVVVAENIDGSNNYTSSTKDIQTPFSDNADTDVWATGEEDCPPP